MCGESIHWLALWLSLLSTCSWCVVSAYTWLALWLLSSPPVAGVWWAHTLDWLYDSLLSTCSLVCGECIHLIGSMYLSSSPPVAGVWWAHTLDWLYDLFSSPPVAGVWWAHWRRCPVAAVASSKCCTLVVVEKRPPHMIVKRFGCTTIHKKALYKCIIHSFINSSVSSTTRMLWTW